MIRTPLKAAVLAAAALAGTAAMILPTAAQAQAVISVQIGPPPPPRMEGPPPGARQIFDISVEMVQTSCGYAVPYYDYVGERDTLARWTEGKGPDGIVAYWDEKNRTTLDGFPTGLFEDET